MVQINFAQKSVTVKVVYYGPGMSGKTTNLEVVHQRAPETSRGELTSISTDGDRTLFFDFMPLDLGTVAGMRTQFQIYTVPGQVYYNSTRKLVLQGVDGVVFVADSSASMTEENLESLRNLEENLAEYGKALTDIPIVIQYNKRDLPDALPVPELERVLNPMGAPHFEAVANTGQGVFPTLKALAARVLDTIHKQAGSGPGKAQARPNAPGAPQGAGQHAAPAAPARAPEGAVKPPMGAPRQPTFPAPEAAPAHAAPQQQPPHHAQPHHAQPQHAQAQHAQPSFFPAPAPASAPAHMPPVQAAATGFYRSPAPPAQAASTGFYPAPGAASAANPFPAAEPPGLAPVGGAPGFQPAAAPPQYPNADPAARTGFYAPPGYAQQAPQAGGFHAPAAPAGGPGLRMAAADPAQAMTHAPAPSPAPAHPMFQHAPPRPVPQAAAAPQAPAPRIRPRGGAMPTPNPADRKSTVTTIVFMVFALGVGVVIGGLAFGLF